MFQIGLNPSRGWRGPQAEGRGLGPLEGTPNSNLDMGRRPEWALPLQTRSACRPEGPATPVYIIMGVCLEFHPVYMGAYLGHRKGPEQRSVDNCPAHRGQAPDGRPTVRQFPTSPDPLSLEMTDHEKGKRLGLLAQAAPSCFRRLARPRSDYRTWMPFPASCRPSARSEEHPHPLPHLPDLEAS